MTDEAITLSRRRVLGGLATIGGASAAAGAGTVAYFSDSESSSGNTVQAGTLELGFDGTNSFSFSAALAPTQSTIDRVTLVNDGSISGSLDVDVSYSESDGASNDTDVTADQVAQNLNVLTLDYDDTSLLGGQNLPSDPTLYELAHNDQAEPGTNNDLVNLADPTSNGTDFTVELELADVGNDFQSDGVAITFDFDLNQTDGQ